MAFKVKRFIPDPSPINIIDPGKVLKAASSTVFPIANTIIDGIKGVSNTVKAYKARNYKDSIDSEPKVKKTSGRGEGTGQGSGSSIKGTSADTRTYDPFSKKTNVKKEKPKREPRNKVTAINTPEQISVKRGDYGKGVETKKGVAKGLDVETPKISTKKPTVRIAPKDNSRKAIKKRKTADKAAGVSKSQMRANKAKSKSEAASAKAKKSKNPSYRAQLTAKSERLAKRAKRKGNS